MLEGKNHDIDRSHYKDGLRYLYVKSAITSGKTQYYFIIFQFLFYTFVILFIDLYDILEILPNLSNYLII